MLTCVSIDVKVIFNVLFIGEFRRYTGNVKGCSALQINNTPNSSYVVGRVVQYHSKVSYHPLTRCKFVACDENRMARNAIYVA